MLLVPRRFRKRLAHMAVFADAIRGERVSAPHTRFDQHQRYSVRLRQRNTEPTCSKHTRFGRKTHRSEQNEKEQRHAVLADGAENPTTKKLLETLRAFQWTNESAFPAELRLTSVVAPPHARVS